MTNHGAEPGLPLSPLAQWMRETTGIQGDDTNYDDFLFVTTPRNTIRIVPPVAHPAGKTITPGPDASVVSGPQVFEFDKGRLYQAAREAVETYITEGHEQHDVLEHERRIWALYDKLLGDNDGEVSR